MTFPGLTPEGAAWLINDDQPTSDFLTGEYLKLSRELQQTFGLSSSDSVTAMVCLVSAMCGNIVTAIDPFGRSIPLTLHVIIDREPALSMSIAVASLVRAVAEVTAAFITSNMPSASDKSKLVVCFAENGGVFHDDLVLLDFLKQAVRPESVDRSKMRAGWYGSIANTASGPVNFTCGFLASGSADVLAVLKGEKICRALPWFLIARPELCHQPVSRSDALNTWKAFTRAMLNTLSVSKEESQLAFDEAASRGLCRLMTVSSEFADPGSIASVVLGTAAEQVLKISGLLHIFSGRNREEPVSDETTEYATFLYRKLLRSTLKFYVGKSGKAPVISKVSEARVLSALRRHGRLSARGVTRNLNNASTADVSRVLDALAYKKSVRELDGGLYELLDPRFSVGGVSDVGDVGGVGDRKG